MPTYPVKYIPSYIFNTLATITTPPSPKSKSPPPLDQPTKPGNEQAIDHKVHDEEDTNAFVRQMLNPLVNNVEAASNPATLFPDLQKELSTEMEEDDMP